MPRILDNDQIGSFKIIEKIGEGGMAIVYKATQPSLKRDVVVKKLKDPNREIIERFKKEAFVSASFSQENVLTIYDFLYHGRSYYLVMEYVEGNDLRTIIDVAAPIPAYVSALIIRDVARGLEYTHSKNIIHRDIKPSNILISRQGEVKLIDFGVAKDEEPSRLTLTGMIVGTPSYMSPEQANGDRVEKQSDIYSLGVLMYEMVTGLKPFSGETNTEILMRIVKGKFPSPRKYNRDLPYRLVRIILKAMRKDKKRRYQNAAELIRDIEKFLPWQEQANKKEIVSHYIRKCDISSTAVTSTKTRLAGAYHGYRFRVWPWAAVISVLLFFSIWQINRFLISERLSRLEIQANTQFNTVLLDGHPLGDMQKNHQVFSNLLPGEHILLVRGPADNGIFRQNIRLDPGKKNAISVQVPLQAARAQVTVVSSPLDAQFFIDDQLIGTTPLQGVKIPSGLHTIKLIKRGYRLYRESYQFELNQSYHLHFTLQPTAVGTE
jgi:serine/threonine-protein kinase